MMPAVWLTFDVEAVEQHGGPDGIAQDGFAGIICRSSGMAR